MLQPGGALRLARTIREARAKLPKTGPVAFSFVSNQTMLRFDHGYTDVLTYPKIDEDAHLGDVYINVDFIKQQYMTSQFLKRIEELAVHSLLHLHDYTHDTRCDFNEMRNKEIELLGRPCLPEWRKQVLV